MDDLLLEVKNIKKKFRIYHEKRNTIFESITSKFSKKKYYDDLKILNDISFELKKGETLGIIGKNGVGKTTLLRIISKIYQPDDGQVILHGKILPFLGVGLGFHPELNARANIIQFGILLGFSKKDIIQKVPEILQFAELENYSDVKLKNFSSGMHVRLAFATAAQIDPDILILDEIMYVGDLGFQKKSYDTIMSFKKRGKGIIIVSHSMSTIQHHCDRAILLDKGKIVSMGKPSDVISDYQKLF